MKIKQSITKFNKFIYVLVILLNLIIIGKAHAGCTISQSSVNSSNIAYSTASSGIYSYYISTCLPAYKDQFTIATSATSSIIGSIPSSPYTYQYYLTWFNDYTGGVLASTTNPSVTTLQCSNTNSFIGQASGLSTSTYVEYKYFAGYTLNAYINLLVTYSTYFIDSYSWYIDKSGFVHFVITQNSPNSVLYYRLHNSTTGQYYYANGITSQTFEIVDYSPKPGATNIYDIAIYVSQYVSPAPSFSNIYVQVPGDIATYNTLVYGYNNDGKSLDATYDKANSAANNAWQAADWLNPASGSASAVKDSSGTVLTAARNAANNTWYNGQSAAYWASVAANNTSALVANIPPAINKVQGQNGATCTTGNSFTVVISATPSNGVSYRVTCGSFDSGWVASNTITITGGIVSGANTATAYVKNSAGATAQTSFTFFKI